MKNRKKNNELQGNNIDRDFKYGGIASIATFILGFLLVMLGIEDTIVIALMFSWIIFLVKMSSASILKKSLYKIISTIYWIFFVIIIIGFFTYVFNIVPSKDKYEHDKIIIKNDSIGFVTNVNVNKNGDTLTIKLVKPTIFKSSGDVDSDVVYRIDNKKIMYLLYDSNIGLHIIYVGYSYLYLYSIVLFLIIIGLFLIELSKFMYSKNK